jgi:uncharacterized protein YceH (UPF0502 family)
VLVEKQLSVPDSYPLTENALKDGCNQKSNRDPLTEFETFQVAGALMALQQRGAVARVEGGGRTAKFRHRLTEELHVDSRELAVLAELLLRGPQAPGALKPRVARMGLFATPQEIEELLGGLARRSPPLVEHLPLGPRERERRWCHLLGPALQGQEPRAAARTEAAGPPPAVRAADLETRVQALEEQVAELRATVQRLSAGQQGG